MGTGGMGTGGMGGPCGNGVVDPGEGCDDQNNQSGDGCSKACAVEPGFTCSGKPSVCVTHCGDGIAAGQEACDDGNTAPGDSCSATCTFEATCGNAKVEPGETCDDGNTTAGDGCSAGCQLEAGSVCGDAVDLRDPAKVTVTGGVTTYAGTTLGATDTTFGAPPSCSAGTDSVPRVVHRYRVGGEPAVLGVATVDVGGLLADTTVWAYLDCQSPVTELACGDDSLTGTLGALSTGYLAAGTTVFLVVSGYSSADVGPYQLRIEETPATREPQSGTCAAPTAVGPGTYAGVTLASDAHSGSASSACGASAPDAVYAVTLAHTSDLRASATSNSGGFDLSLSLLGAPCATGAEVTCADAAGAGAGESLVARDLPAGTYHVVVGGYGVSDVGPYTLALDLVEVLSLGAACDPADAAQRCATGAYCHAGTCQTPSEVLFADFSVDLSPFVVTDFGADGQTWSYCDPAGGCAFDNATGASPTDPYALVRDQPGVSLHGEVLTSPALSATGLTLVVLELDQLFVHATASADLGAVEVSTNGTTWTTVASYTTDTPGHTSIDLSAMAAGQAAFQVRFRYDDQTSAMGDPFAAGWSLDNVHVYGF
jgi:cysteine-rich repeat protein